MEKYILANIRLFCSKLEDINPPSSITYTKSGELEKPSSDKASGWSMPRNVAHWCNYLTFDVMGDLCFGKAFEMLDSEKNRHVTELISSAAHMHLIVSLDNIHHPYLVCTSVVKS